MDREILDTTILGKIISTRKERVLEKGFSFGHLIPEKRQRPIFPFLPKRGLILEIKKASPSKGWISKNLDVEKRALLYSQAGASAISVLTDEDFFKGSIKDLIAVSKAIEKTKIAILRKDFLTDIEDIEVSYRIGADAILLIASVLDFEKSKLMIEKTLSYGMSILYEVRSIEEFEQYQALAGFFSKTRKDFFDKVILGVNARDLKTFHIDPLLPLQFLSKLLLEGNKKTKLIYESGIHTKEMVQKLSSLGFYGLLIGESLVQEKNKAESFVKIFNKTKKEKHDFWKTYVSLLDNKTVHRKKILKKICGFTQVKDALFAQSRGADFLGFIFSNKSKRNASAKCVKDFSQTRNEKKSIRVGVITDMDSNESLLAQKLIKKGFLDVLQLHDFDIFYADEKKLSSFLLDLRKKRIAYYCALSQKNEKDIALYTQLKKMGEFRILLDVPKTSETAISQEFIKKIDGPFWLAGGLDYENSNEYIERFDIELLDFARATESEQIGIKDFKKTQKILEI